MNERIKELAIQAKLEHCVSHVRLQEFAELIIRDVMENRSMDEYDCKHLCEDYGLHYQPTLMKNPNYGDLFTADEWEEASDAGYFIPDDGDGYWATEKEYSSISCWNDKPDWATHVMWFNK